MTAPCAVGVIVGANVGTMVIAQIIAFNLVEVLARDKRLDLFRWKSDLSEAVDRLRALSGRVANLTAEVVEEEESVAGR